MLNQTIRKVSRPVALVILIAITIAAFSLVPTSAVRADATAGKVSTSDFRSAMRKLWEDHITWTRLYIVNFAAGLPEADPTSQRLLQNQVDLGNAIKPYYGNAAGDQLTSLLKQHILGAVAVLKAAKSGDKAKLATATTDWYANGNDIAAFLSKANPSNWPLDQMKSQMKMHLDLTLAEATDHLNGNWGADISDYDKVHTHILGLADALSSGIENQFPDKFTGPKM